MPFEISSRGNGSRIDVKTHCNGLPNTCASRVATGPEGVTMSTRGDLKSHGHYR